jgi:hypothetical protein
VKGAPRAVLFVVVRTALGIFQKLAEQGNAVVKGEARLQDVDEVPGKAVFLLTVGALQQILVPPGVAGKPLGAVDGDGI